MSKMIPSDERENPAPMGLDDAAVEAEESGPQPDEFPPGEFAPISAADVLSLCQDGAESVTSGPQETDDYADGVGTVPDILAEVVSAAGTPLPPGEPPDDTLIPYGEDVPSDEPPPDVMPPDDLPPVVMPPDEPMRDSPVITDGVRMDEVGHTTQEEHPSPPTPRLRTAARSARRTASESGTTHGDTSESASASRRTAESITASKDAPEPAATNRSTAESSTTHRTTSGTAPASPDSAQSDRRPSAEEAADRAAFFGLDFRELDRNLTPEQRREWNAIYASFRGHSVMTGSIYGIDRTYVRARNPRSGEMELRRLYCAVVIPYRVRILIPETEMWFPEEERPDFVLRNMPGAIIHVHFTNFPEKGRPHI